MLFSWAQKSLKYFFNNGPPNLVRASGFFMTNLLIRTSGHILYMHVLGQPMIVLSSQEAVRDLMEKRSAIYSDRPRFVLLNELFVSSDIHRKLS